MLTFYLTGVLVAFLIMAYRLAAGVACLNSLRAKNLRKIGQYYSFAKGTFVQEKQTQVSIACTFFVALVVEPLLSWINVSLACWRWFSTFVNRTSTPEYIKEFRFKLGHTELSKEEIERMGRDLARKQGIELAETESEDNTLSEDDRGFYAETNVLPSRFEFHCYSHPPEYEHERYTKYLYRIDGLRVEAKLTECYETNPRSGGSVREYEVRDCVVLESEIRARLQTETLLLTSLDEVIRNLKQAVEWGEVSRHDLRYFLLGKHPELLPTPEYRRFLRQELERVRYGVAVVGETAREIGYVVKEWEFGARVLSLPENATASEKKALEEKAKQVIGCDLYERSGISQAEFRESKRIEDCLLKFLGEKE
jgi:hypothetical protein